MRHRERFCLEAGSHLTLSSDDPERVYRVQTTDAVNGVRADLQVTPATPLFWDVVGSDYRTTLDSIVEGTITIDGTAHAVSTPCAFEHSSWTVPSPGTPHRPARCRRSGTTSTSSGPAATHRSGPSSGTRSATRREGPGLGVPHLEPVARPVDVRRLRHRLQGHRRPRRSPASRRVEVTATKGDETFAYRANVRPVMSSPAGGAPGLSDSCSTATCAENPR